MSDSESSEALDLGELRLGIEQTLAHLQRAGVTYLPAANVEEAQKFAAQWSVGDQPPESDSSTEPAVARTSSDSQAPAEASAPAAPSKPAVAPPQTPLVDAGPGTYTTVALPLAERQSSLAQWQSVVSECTQCHELACTRRTTVFGEGSAEARVCFFGEAPGADEDRQGRPFVGPAGQLLTKIIEASKMKREDVYILNTLKCRPPGNRNPLPEELANCRKHFEAQLEIIQPDYIVCLGLFAAQSLLDTTLSIGRMRGKFHKYLGSKVVVTYHPAYLLRNEKMKGACWQDMQMMMRDMGVL